MSLIDEATKLDRSHVVLGIGAFLSIIAPGFLTIYLYKPALVATLDTFKLLVFSAALTLPVVILNQVAATLMAPPNAKDQHAVSLLLGMAATCLVFYTALLISYLSFLSFKGYVAIIAGFQCMVFLAVCLYRRHSA